MSKAKNGNEPTPKMPGNNKRWEDQYSMKPRVERRIAQRIGGDPGSMDKPVTFPKGKK